MALNKKWKRSDNYRQRFFQTHRKPARGWKCPYCGRRIRDNKRVEIDHIVSVYNASHSFLARCFIRGKGWAGVNDPRNLVASCHRCNHKKGRRGGFWIWRGFMGQRSWYWPVVWILRILVITVVAWGVWTYGGQCINWILGNFA